MKGMEGLVGHEDVVRRFMRSLESGRLHHAWLLHGPKGIGKTSLAMELARRYLCASHAGCGHCHACRMLRAGSHPDFLFVEPLEGKRDLAIGQIRSALDFLALSGRESMRRVVLLDDAERMNPQAANALLKGLEEPSAGALLLLVCSELMLLPATVRSRCLLVPCALLDETASRRIWEIMGLDASLLSLARMLGPGTPGRAACLKDERTARAMQEWLELAGDAAKADVGKVDAWLRANLPILPATLVAELTVRMHLPCLEHELDFGRRQGIAEALQTLMRWPRDAARHTLRRAPTFLAAFLQLRAALRG